MYNPMKPKRNKTFVSLLYYIMFILGAFVLSLHTGCKGKACGITCQCGSVNENTCRCQVDSTCSYGKIWDQSSCMCKPSSYFSATIQTPDSTWVLNGGKPTDAFTSFDNPGSNDSIHIRGFEYVTDVYGFTNLVRVVQIVVLLDLQNIKLPLTVMQGDTKANNTFKCEYLEVGSSDLLYSVKGPINNANTLTLTKLDISSVNKVEIEGSFTKIELEGVGTARAGTTATFTSGSFYYKDIY